MNALMIVNLLFTIAVIGVAYMVIAWVWRHREKPERPAMDDMVEEANRTMRQVFAGVGDSMREVMGARRGAEARHEQKILGECDRVYQASFTERLGPDTGDWREDSTDWQVSPPPRDWTPEVREDVYWSGCQAIFKASLAGHSAAEIERKRRAPQQFDLFEAQP